MSESRTPEGAKAETPPPYLRPDRFWSRRWAWPIDGPGQVFLARAFDQLGSARFGSLWLGVQNGGRPKPFPSAEHRRFADQDQVLLAADLLKTHNAQLWTTCESELRDGVERLRAAPRGRAAAMHARKLAEASFSFDLWDEAERIEVDLFAAGPNPFRQWDAVQSELHQHLLDGSLASYVRPVEGGLSRPLYPTFWNTEVWRSRFRTCRFNDEDPYAPTAINADSDEGSYIFIDKNELDLLLKQQPGGPSDGAPLEYEPPFLALIIAVCRQLRITGVNPAEPADIEATLETVWEARRGSYKPLSDILKAKMITILREPGAPKGSMQINSVMRTGGRPKGKSV